MARQEQEEGVFEKRELPERFTVKKLSRWLDKRYNKEYWKRLEQNWKQWKGERRRQTLETIKEEEKTEQKNLEIRD